MVGDIISIICYLPPIKGTRTLHWLGNRWEPSMIWTSSHSISIRLDNIWASYPNHQSISIVYKGIVLHEELRVESKGKYCTSDQFLQIHFSIFSVSLRSSMLSTNPTPSIHHIHLTFHHWRSRISRSPPHYDTPKLWQQNAVGYHPGHNLLVPEKRSKQDTCGKLPNIA